MLLAYLAYVLTMDHCVRDDTMGTTRTTERDCSTPVCCGEGCTLRGELLLLTHLSSCWWCVWALACGCEHAGGSMLWTAVWRMLGSLCGLAQVDCHHLMRPLKLRQPWLHRMPLGSTVQIEHGTVLVVRIALGAGRLLRC